MGSPSAIISLGLGSWSTPSLVLTLGLGAGEAEVVVPGPFRSVAGQAWGAGAMQSQAHAPGSVTGQPWVAGSMESEAV